MNKHFFCIALILALLVMNVVSVVASNVIYVDCRSCGRVQDGKSWATAFEYIQTGLDSANSGDQVWVSEGVYYESLLIKPNVALYGGFSGMETALAQRDHNANPTVIDGLDSNSSVVYASSGSTIDGFVIKNGACGIRGSNAVSVIVSNTIVDCKVGMDLVSLQPTNVPDSTGTHCPVIRHNAISNCTCPVSAEISSYVSRADNYIISNDSVTSKDGFQEPAFVPGQIIVRMRSEYDSSVRDGTLTNTQTSRLAKLNAKHSLRKMEMLLNHPVDSSPHLLRKRVTSAASTNIVDIESRFQRTYKLTFDETANVEQIVSEYQADPNVEYAQPNYIYQAQFDPDDYYYNTDLASPPVYSWGQVYPDLWGLKEIGCPDAWDLAKGEGVVVAVIDTGVDYNHIDLANNVWTNPGEIPGNGIDDDGNGYIDDIHGWDFANSDSDPLDDFGHGTHCSGTIAAIGNNTIGVIGVAPHAKIMPVKFLNSSGHGSSALGAEAIYYAALNGAQVLSNSWGADGVTSDPTLEAAIDYACSLGCVVVASAGNDNTDVATQSPANYEKVITVASTDYEGKKAPSSNYGSGVDISAPGVDILSLRASDTDMYGDGSHTIGTDYMIASGTSMACPHVSGVLALVWSLHPDWTCDQVEEQVL